MPRVLVVIGSVGLLALSSQGCSTGVSTSPSGSASARPTGAPSSMTSARPSASPSASTAVVASASATPAAATDVGRYRLTVPAGWRAAPEQGDGLMQVDATPAADGATGVMLIAPADHSIWQDHNDPADETDLVSKAAKGAWILLGLPIVAMDSTGKLDDGFFEKGHTFDGAKEPRALIAIRKKKGAKSLYCVAQNLNDAADRDTALEICKSAQF